MKKVLEGLQQSEQNILSMLPSQVTSEDLFWLRVDIATYYLDHKYNDPGKVKEIISNKRFWNWFLRCWTINDKQIYGAITRNECWARLPVGLYIQSQWAKLQRLEMTKTIKKAVLV